MNRSPIPVFCALALFVGVLSLWGCLQLETPHTFKEDEEIRNRAKNLHKYYQDLEEEIRLEQYHIKLLQDTLDINLTREQALAEEIQKQEEVINRMVQDSNKLLVFSDLSTPLQHHL